MRGAVRTSAGMRFVELLSWLALVGGFLAAVTALVCHWAVNAESLGAHNAGSALFCAFVGAATLVGSTYAAPILIVLAILSSFFQRRAALRFLASGAACALPIAVLTWLGQM